MLTFEEFFVKKKIDITKFKQAEPELFSEFAVQYPLMGEKSFDHSKKFLFNKLRRLYHTPNIPKAEKPVVVNNLASQAEYLSSPTITQQEGFTESKPENVAHVTNGETLSEEEKKPITNPPGFKPRFTPKMAVKKTTSPDLQEENSSEINSTIEETPKPAKKPGFNMKTLIKNKEDIKPGEKTAPERTSAPEKSVYKPKYNLKTTVKDKTIEEDSIPGVPSDAPGKTTQQKSAQSYKPRFNVRNIKPKEDK